MKTYFNSRTWRREAESLFGLDPSEWVFKCSICGSVHETKEVYAFFPSIRNAVEGAGTAMIFCPACKQTLTPEKPHHAILFIKGEHIPIFDFYRPADTGKRARATGSKNSDELPAG